MTTLPTSGVEKLQLPRLTRSESQARSALAQRIHATPFSWGGQAWTLTLVPLADAGAQPFSGADWCVRALWAGAPFEIVLPADAAQAWIEARFPGLEVPQLPDEFVAATLEAACVPLLQGMTALGRGHAQVRGLARGPGHGEALPHHFELFAQCGGQVVRGRLATNALGLMMAAGQAAALHSATNALLADDLPVRLAVQIGQTTLCPEDIATLALGDAVLIERVFLTTTGELWLGGDGWGLRVQWGPDGLTVTRPFTNQGIIMPADDTLALPDDEPVALNQLPLQLTFDLGERTLTLGELRSLQVGQSLELGRALPSAVSLRVNGALIGMGELIEIDGRLGVMINSLGQAPRAAPSGQAPAQAEHEGHDAGEKNSSYV